MLYNTKDIVEATDAKMYLRKLIEQGKKVEIKAINKPRSITLNAYLHVAITLYAIHFGYTLEEAKTLLKRMCSFMIYEKNGQKFLRKTSKLDNVECSEFVKWIRNHASKQGCYIPTPEEYKKNQFNIDKEISKHKEFL